MNMGRKEIDISEIDMSGGTRIYVCIHITNNYSTQDHATDTSTHDESADVFSWKGKIIEDYWECSLDDFIRM